MKQNTDILMFMLFLGLAELLQKGAWSLTRASFRKRHET